ncbi:hypothetical protein [Saccharothrix sp. HUAS TT1]|uniref:hypothetical protein n=1 Tax=unclassified Saccharothrix TaxID=2593673 RepID=UPI00345B4E65
MPIRTIPPVPAEAGTQSQRVLVRVAEHVARGIVPSQARHALADLLVLVDQHARTLPTPVVAAVDAVVAAYQPTLHPEVRTVRVQDRQDHFPRIVTVTVPWVCPKCGGPRGEVNPTEIPLFGSRRAVDTWRNPCGHIDHHRDVVREAARFRELVDVDALAEQTAAPADRPAPATEPVLVIQADPAPRGYAIPSPDEVAASIPLAAPLPSTYADPAVLAAIREHLAGGR